MKYTYIKMNEANRTIFFMKYLIYIYIYIYISDNYIKTDVIPLVNEAWKPSFARVDEIYGHY